MLGLGWADARVSGWDVQLVMGKKRGKKEEREGKREERRVDPTFHVNTMSLINGHFNTV